MYFRFSPIASAMSESQRRARPRVCLFKVLGGRRALDLRNYSLLSDARAQGAAMLLRCIDSFCLRTSRRAPRLDRSR